MHAYIVFHPKQKVWYDYMMQSSNNNKNILQTLNEVSRVSFAILFVILRMVLFPYVAIYVGVLPDCIKAIKERPEFTTPLTAIATFSVLFTCMQLYWGSLVVKQILKALRTTGGGGGGDSGGKGGGDGDSDGRKQH